MNRVSMWILAGFAAVALAGPARAQLFTQSGPLEGMRTGSRSLSVYLGGGDGTMGVMGELRTATSSRATAGIAGSLEGSVFGLQADTRAGLLDTGGSVPLTLGGQLAGGFLTGGGSTGFYAQAVPGLSFDWTVGDGQSFSSWAGLGFRVTAASHQVGRGDGVFRAGTRFNFSPTVGFGASLEDVGGNSRLLAGATYAF